MKGVIDYGTGAYLRGSKYNLRCPIAGKTGTTQNNSDGWFMGITPDLVAGCWVKQQIIPKATEKRIPCISSLINR
jgi:penicillin-binding protein 1A